MERAKWCKIVFWISGAAAILLITMDRLSSGSETPEQGYLASDTFFYVGMMSIVVMANGAQWAFRSYQQEIADLKSGDADVSTATQDSE